MTYAVPRKQGGHVLSVGDLRIVIMNCPYDTWEQSQTRDMFGKMVGLKIRGYRSEYAYGVLPLDTTDFVGCHFMLCEDRHGQLQPIMACRTTTLERCRTHRLPFPALTLAAMANASRHFEQIQAIVDRCARQGTRISYEGSWTIEPRVRKELRIMRDIFRDILTAMFVLVHDENGIQEAILGGVMRLGTDKFFRSLGYRPLEHNGAALPPLAVQPLLGEPVTLMHLKEFTPSARAIADRYLALWERRLTIEASTEVIETVRDKVSTQ